MGFAIRMENKLVAIFERVPGQTRAALVSSEIGAQELHVQFDHATSQIGGIFGGRIKAFHKGLQAAFVDIGGERTGYLEAKDVQSISGKNGKEDNDCYLSEGRNVIVSVVRDAISEKGPKLTTRLQFLGNHLTFFPRGNGIRISKNIQGKAEREKLFHVLEDKLDGRGGIIAHRTANEVSIEALETELVQLKRDWDDVLKVFRRMRSPGVILEPCSLEEQLLTSWSHFNVKQIIFSGYKPGYENNILPPELSNCEVIRESEFCDLFAKYSIDAELENALQPGVTLPNGARLFISETPALVAVDVDVGSANSPSQNSLELEVNLFAAERIYHEIRLRRLSGLIVIDFVDMVGDKHRNKLISHINHLFACDAVPTRIGGFTRMGLFEITRQRLRPSILETITACCSSCEGTGHVDLGIARGFDLIRQLAMQKGGNADVSAAVDVIAALNGPARAAFEALEERLGRKLSIKADIEETPGGFQVINSSSG
ncbi:MAG: Ribonuclease G [Alphaproteobacteria bacterium MarineAlpha3_Bin5]|nr:MAG: Ribonuclease G [Alphaproteobacteria bacterium MarineAlpha3_Bin5]